MPFMVVGDKYGLFLSIQFFLFKAETFLSYFGLKIVFFTFSELEFSTLAILNYNIQNACNDLTLKSIWFPKLYHLETNGISI